MPAIITHHLFGTDVYSELAETIGCGAEERDAFLLGNIGPDPLFCLKALPHRMPNRKIGGTMHAKRPTELLSSFHLHFVVQPGNELPEASVLKAYALGFLCHYLLDSTAHPLVYAQQRAVRNELSKDPACGFGSGEIHALIETELDEYVLTKRLGVTVAAFKPYREALPSANWALKAVSKAFRGVVADTYGIRVSDSALATSVKLYRMAQRAIDSKHDGLRKHVDYARLAGKRYLRIDAMTHADELKADTPFANNDHVPWPHPFLEDAIVAESFDDLYGRTRERVLEVVPRFAQPSCPHADIAAITGGINFSGKPAGEYVAD